MSQLALFALDPAPARRYGMPPDVARRWELAFSPQVKGEIAALAAGRTGEWLALSAFRPLSDEHGIGFCLGHVLSALAREGVLEERPVYLGKGIGAEQPGTSNYRGYCCEWRAI